MFERGDYRARDPVPLGIYSTNNTFGLRPRPFHICFLPFSALLLSPVVEDQAWIHRRALQPLWRAEEGEWRPSGEESCRWQVHHRGATRRTKSGRQGLGHHTVPVGLWHQVSHMAVIWSDVKWCQCHYLQYLRLRWSLCYQICGFPHFTLLILSCITIQSLSVNVHTARLRQLSCAWYRSQGLADNAVISRVNGELWDLDRPLEQDCSLEILRFDNEDAQAVSSKYLRVILHNLLNSSEANCTFTASKPLSDLIKPCSWS